MRLQLLLAGLGFPILAAAQSPRAMATVTGVAWDSLSHRALSGGYVIVERTERAASTDRGGAFRIDSLVAGEYTLTLMHPVLDSLGLQPVTRRVTLREGANELALAVPSRATIWRRVCGARPEGADSGVVFGAVRSAVDGRPVAAARVVADWSAMALDAPKHVSEQQWRGESSSDAEGMFALCGLPLETFVHLRMMKDSASTGLISVVMDARGVLHRDVLIAVSAAGRVNQRGTVSGEVRAVDGQPLSEVTVVVDGVDTTRSDARGQFRVADVPLGSRQLEVRKLGYMPLVTIADVAAGGTDALQIQMTRVTALAEVRVLGSQVRAVRAAEYLDRRQHNVGHFLDSTSIARYHTLTSLFTDVPTVRVRNGVLLMRDGRGGMCQPATFIDGVQEEWGEMAYVHSDQLAAIEVYAGPYVPTRFQTKRRNSCGVVVVWTKFSFP